MSAAADRLRQEAATFDQQKVQADRWFAWRLAAAWIALIQWPVITGFCLWIIATSEHRSASVVIWASTALGGEILGLIVTVVRTAMNPSSMPKLNPVTPAKRLPRQSPGR